jgi:hypothetical protein
MGNSAVHNSNFLKLRALQIRRQELYTFPCCQPSVWTFSLLQMVKSRDLGSLGLLIEGFVIGLDVLHNFYAGYAYRLPAFRQIMLHMHWLLLHLRWYPWCFSLKLQTLSFISVLLPLEGTQHTRYPFGVQQIASFPLLSIRANEKIRDIFHLKRMTPKVAALPYPQQYWGIPMYLDMGHMTKTHGPVTGQVGWCMLRYSPYP